MAYSDVLRTTTWTASDLASLIDGMAYGINQWGGVSGGSVNAQTITVSPTPAAYANGQVYSFYATYTNNGSATLNVNSLGATTIRDAKTGAVLIGNEIYATGVFTVVYYNSLFYLINGANGSATWVPTITGFSANPTNTVYYYTRNGRQITCFVRQATPGTSNATGFSITAPVTALTLTNMVWVAKAGDAFNNSVYVADCEAYISSGGTIINLANAGSATGWTAAGTKSANFTLVYEAA